jgi:hypothetical protein
MRTIISGLKKLDEKFLIKTNIFLCFFLFGSLWLEHQKGLEEQ